MTLQHILRSFRQTFIVLDALDECNEREELLGLIRNLTSWKVEKLHVLATSRRERDIEESLLPLINDQICIQSALVNADIRTHVREQLRSDPKLQKWHPDIQMEIEQTLTDGAQGMSVTIISSALIVMEYTDKSPQGSDGLHVN